MYAGLAAFGASSGSFEAKNVNVKNAHLAILPQFFIGENSVVTVKNCKTDNNTNGVASNLSHSWDILNCDFASSKSASLYLNKYSNNIDAELPAGKSFIKNNKINVSGGVALAAFDMENTEVKNNVFYGSGFTGLYSERGNNWNILNNDFCDISPSSGSTLFLIIPENYVVQNNSNQIVAGIGIDDPSNFIGEGKECDE
jgi:hypothetical protein